MAIFHAHFGTVQRSKGQNAIASAAYIGGICLKKLDGEMADYRKKKNVCGHKIIMPTKFAHVKTPSAQWAWNEAENSENRKNSTTARRGDLALPKEFTQDECFEVGYIYAHDIVDKYGVVAQVNFHDLATNNPHIDMQWTTRSFDGQKLGTKTRILDDKKTGPEEIVWMREQWATRVNEVLAKYGKSIDHRSYADQGNEKLATKHLGRKCTALERKGIKTEKANHNDKVRGYNRLIDEKNIVTQEINLLQEQILEDKNEHIQQEKVCRSGRENIPAKDKTCELGGSRRNASSSSWGAGNHENPNPKQQGSQQKGSAPRIFQDVDRVDKRKRATEERDSSFERQISRNNTNITLAETSSQAIFNSSSRNENITEGCRPKPQQDQTRVNNIQHEFQRSHRTPSRNSELYPKDRKGIGRTESGSKQNNYGRIQPTSSITERGSETPPRNGGHSNATTFDHEQAHRQAGELNAALNTSVVSSKLIYAEQANNIEDMVQSMAADATLKALAPHVQALRTREFMEGMKQNILSSSKPIAQKLDITDVMARLSAQITLREIERPILHMNNLYEQAHRQVRELHTALNTSFVPSIKPYTEVLNNIQDVVQSIAGSATLKALAPHVQALRTREFMVGMKQNIISSKPIAQELDITDVVERLSAQATLRKVEMPILHINNLYEQVHRQASELHTALQSSLATATKLESKNMIEVVTRLSVQATLQKIEQIARHGNNLASVIATPWHILEQLTLQTIQSYQDTQNIAQVSAKIADITTAKHIRKTVHKIKFEQRLADFKAQKQPVLVGKTDVETLKNKPQENAQNEHEIAIIQNNSKNTEVNNDTRYNDSFKPK